MTYAEIVAEAMARPADQVDPCACGKFRLSAITWYIPIIGEGAHYRDHCPGLGGAR